MSTDENPILDMPSSSAGIGVESIVEGLKDVHDAVGLENALSNVKPGIGNCKSRRKLKRAIEQVIGKEEIEKSMNAKVRRRVTRVIGFLAPNPDAQDDKKEEEKSNLVASNAKLNNNSNNPNSASAEEQNRHVPYVVFVGQLNFNTTSEDLKSFFQSQNINGNIRVRLLSNKDDGRSKGMAFVEVDNAAEMHKCIALHRSVLHGKMINIEKSCGGASKDKRRLKIQEKRTEQTSKLNEAVQRIITEYSAAGTIDPDNLGESFRSKLHNCGPAIISKVFLERICFTNFIPLPLLFNCRRFMHIQNYPRRNEK